MKTTANTSNVNVRFVL